MIDFIYSLNSDPKKAFEELKVKVEHLDFKPNLAVVYLTENLQKDAQLFRFDFDTLCVPVEASSLPRVFGREDVFACLPTLITA